MGLCWWWVGEGPSLLDSLGPLTGTSHIGSDGVPQSQGYCWDRGEILGPQQEHPMRKRLAGRRSPIKNESEKIQDDQIPLSFSTVNGAGEVIVHPSSLDGVDGCLHDSLPTSNP